MSFVSAFVAAAKSICTGLGVTMHNLRQPVITRKYPYERPDLPIGFRGIPVLLSDEEGRLKCTSCEMCARACPVGCIEIRSHRGDDKKRVLDVYNLDATWCMYCGLCVEACPFDALAMSDQYELATADAGDLLFSKDRLAILGRTQQTATVNFGIKTGGELG